MLALAHGTILCGIWASCQREWLSWEHHGKKECPAWRPIIGAAAPLINKSEWRNGWPESCQVKYAVPPHLRAR